MVGAEGFEPPIDRLKAGCFIPFSYAPNILFKYYMVCQNLNAGIGPKFMRHGPRLHYSFRLPCSTVGIIPIFSVQWTTRKYPGYPGIHHGLIVVFTEPYRPAKLVDLVGDAPTSSKTFQNNSTHLGIFVALAKNTGATLNQG